MTKEIIFYGRGGQGVVIASRVLALAAFKEGKNVQSFPFFGVERRGAPVAAFTRISTSEIRKRSPIDTPDYIVVFDPTLIENKAIARGLRQGGGILINSKSGKSSFDFGKNIRIFTFDAATVAYKYGLGSESAPIVNTAILGAFSKFTNEVKIDSLTEAIREYIVTRTSDNMEAAKEAYNGSGK